MKFMLMKTISGGSAAPTPRRRFSPALRSCCVALLFVASSALAGFPQTAARSHKAPTPIKVGIVKDTSSFEEGGCSLQLPADQKKESQRYVFMSDLENDHAVINVDGKDLKLKPVSHREPKGEPKKGDRSTFNYAGKETAVRVDFVATEVCSPNDEGCEATSYDATITVIRGLARQVVKVKGMCGV
jgi:hypothetical protein